MTLDFPPNEWDEHSIFTQTKFIFFIKSKNCFFFNNVLKYFIVKNLRIRKENFVSTAISVHKSLQVNFTEMINFLIVIIDKLILWVWDFSMRFASKEEFRKITFNEFYAMILRQGWKWNLWVFNILFWCRVINVS